MKRKKSRASAGSIQGEGESLSTDTDLEDVEQVQWLSNV